MMATVSVIIPTYNRAGVIRRSIDSVLAQTFDDMEIIVIDDGSTDNMGEIVQSIPDERIRYIPCETNRGTSAARNEGLKVAQGKYIAFLDSDDEWLPEKIEKQVALMESLPAEWGVCHTGARIIKDGSIKTTFIPKPVRNKKLLLRFVFGKFHFFTPSLMIRSACFDHVGHFDERLWRWEDRELLLRIFRLYKLAVISEPLVVIHMATTKNLHALVESSCLTTLYKHERGIRDNLSWCSARRFRSVAFRAIGEVKLRAGETVDGSKYLLRSLCLYPFITPIQYVKLFLLVFGLFNVFKCSTRRFSTILQFLKNGVTTKHFHSTKKGE